MRKETKKAPTIRFRGFTDDWEQRKLEDIVDKAVDNRGKTPPISEEGIHPLIEVASLGNGAPDYTKVTKYLDDETFESALRDYIKEGDILFSTVGSIGLVSLMDSREDAAIAQNIVAFRAKENNDSKFIYAMLSTEENQYKAWRIVMGAVQPSIKVSQLIHVEYCVSQNLEEQRKIGEYFTNLDHLITLHQCKLDQLKTLKKYFLQNMFPAKGEKVPRIRFKGFTGDWEQRKLEDLASFSKGSGYSKSDLQASGTPIVLYGRLYTKYETVIKDIDTFVDALADSVYSQGGEVIVPASGETAEDISIASVVEKPGIVLGGDLNIIHPTDDLDSTFLAISISHGNPHKEMAKRAQGKSVVHLHNNDLAQIKLWYPSVTEQRKISQYFSGLDTLITLHQRKLNQLQTMKKFMLQNLFI